MAKARVLVADIGGTHVKLMISARETRKFDSGKKVTPQRLMELIKETAADWDYDAISLGFPAPIKEGRVMKDPNHLARGWIGWDFAKSLGTRTRVINDAAMQALGSYHGGRMLFLGLGTGLGSTLIWERNVLPLELGDLPYPGIHRIEDLVGKHGLEKLGPRKWLREVESIVARLKLAFIADYVVLGGGNARLVERPPEGIELGKNENAYRGGQRLWEIDARSRQPKWRIL